MVRGLASESSLDRFSAEKLSAIDGDICRLTTAERAHLCLLFDKWLHTSRLSQFHKARRLLSPHPMFPLAVWLQKDRLSEEQKHL